MQNFEFVCWDWSCSRGISWTLVVCVGKPWIHWTFNSIPIPAISKLWQGRRRNCKTRIEASAKWKTWLLSHGKLQLGHFWRHDLTNKRQWQIQIQRQSGKLGFSHMENSNSATFGDMTWPTKRQWQRHSQRQNTCLNQKWKTLLLSHGDGSTTSTQPLLDTKIQRQRERFLNKVQNNRALFGYWNPSKFQNRL